MGASPGDAPSQDDGGPAGTGPADVGRRRDGVQGLHVVNGVLGGMFATALTVFLLAAPPSSVVAVVCLATSLGAAAVARALHRGRLKRPHSPRSRRVAFWLLVWPGPIGWLLSQALVLGGGGEGGEGAEDLAAGDVASLVCFAVMLIAVCFAAVRTAPRSAVDPSARLSRPGHDLSWRQRREIAWSVRDGRPLAASRDDDVRAVIDRMLDGEFVAWVALLVAFGLAAFAVTGVATGRAAMTLWASAGLAVLVAVVVLRRIAATKRYLSRLDDG